MFRSKSVKIIFDFSDFLKKQKKNNKKTSDFKSNDMAFKFFEL